MSDSDPPGRVRLNPGRYTAAALACAALIDFGAVITIQASRTPRTGPVSIGEIWGEAIPWSVLGLALGIAALITYIATLLREDILTNRVQAQKHHDDLMARLDAQDEKTADIAGAVREAAVYQMVVEGQSARAYAGDLFERALKSIDDLNTTLQERRRDPGEVLADEFTDYLRRRNESGG